MVLRTVSDDGLVIVSIVKMLSIIDSDEVTSLQRLQLATKRLDTPAVSEWGLASSMMSAI